MWGAGAGSQDGAHVSSAEPSKRHCPAQGVDQCLFTVGGTESEQDLEFGFQPGVADRGSADEELLSFGAEGAELFLRFGFRPRST